MRSDERVAGAALANPVLISILLIGGILGITGTRAEPTSPEHREVAARERAFTDGLHLPEVLNDRLEEAGLGWTHFPATPVTAISIKCGFPVFRAASTASLILRCEPTKVDSTPIDLASDWKSTFGWQISIARKPCSFALYCGWLSMKFFRIPYSRLFKTTKTTGTSS